MIKKELRARIYEEPFHKKDSAISSSRIIQKEEDSLSAVIQFRDSKNFRNDLSWCPTYDEICFVMRTIYEAEDYNNYVKTIPKGERHSSFETYRDIERAGRTLSSEGWVRIGDNEYKLAGREVLRRPVKEDSKK